MHIQARALPQKSPPDLVEFLKVLAGVGTEAEPINVEGVTGSSVEDGGHFVFAVAHDREQECHSRLADQGYRCQWTTDLYREPIPPEPAWGQEPDPNRPGVLLGIVQRAKDSEIAAGRPINTLLIGAVTNESGRFFAQVTFVGADWKDEVPTEQG